VRPKPRWLSPAIAAKSSSRRCSRPTGPAARWEEPLKPRALATGVSFHLRVPYDDAPQPPLAVLVLAPLCWGAIAGAAEPWPIPTCQDPRVAPVVGRVAAKRGPAGHRATVPGGACGLVYDASGHKRHWSPGRRRRSQLCGLENCAHLRFDGQTRHRPGRRPLREPVARWPAGPRFAATRPTTEQPLGLGQVRDWPRAPRRRRSLPAQRRPGPARRGGGCGRIVVWYSEME